MELLTEDHDAHNDKEELVQRLLQALYALAQPMAQARRLDDGYHRHRLKIARTLSAY